VLLIDTPGFDDTVRSDADIIVEISKCLLAQKKLGVRLMGAIYLYDITRLRMTGSLQRQLVIMKLIVGKESYKHVLLVTTKWGDKNRRSEFENRQAELEDEYWEDIIEEGASVCKFDGSTESARGIVSQLNAGTDVTLALQRQMTARNHVHLKDTDVGRYALKSREDNRKYYQRLKRKPSKTSKEELDELETSLRLGQKDPAKLEVELDEKIEQMIQKAVEEEMRKSRNKPTAIHVISWILSLVGAILTGVSAFA
jgi:hypothetical protein